MATVIDICGDSSAESPQTKFACIACLLMLSECSNYGTFGFKGQNLTQTSRRCVIVMIHGNFREAEGRKTGRVRNESRNGNVFRTWSNYSLRIYLVLFICMFLWRMQSLCLWFWFVSLSFSPWLVFTASWPWTWPPSQTLSWLIRFSIHWWVAVVSGVFGQNQKGVRVPVSLVSQDRQVLGCLWEIQIASLVNQLCSVWHRSYDM